MSRLPQRFYSRQDTAAPVLLPTFALSTGVVVLVVLLIARSASDLAAIAGGVLVLVLAGAFLFAVERRLAEPPDDERDRGS